MWTVVCVVAGLWWWGAKVPSFNEVRAHYHSSEALLLDRHEQPLHVLRVDFDGRRLNWIPLAEISLPFQTALTVSEDQHFDEHQGVDWWALGKGLLTTGAGQGSRGASTITMQLASLIDPTLKPHLQRRSFWQKVLQIRLALAIERKWAKSEILEAYANLASFRGELQGIEAMARGLFGQSPDALDQRASSIGVVLLRAPNAKAPVVARRACNLIEQVWPDEDCIGLDDYVQVVLSRPLPIAYSEQLAPHLAQQLLKNPGDQVITTLDKNIQQMAVKLLRRYLLDLKKQQVEDGAIVVIDNDSGDMLAWVGSSGELSQSRHVDGVRALRQAGSTLKPFLYGAAIEGQWFTAASILNDTPLSLETGNGLYTPQNYDRQYRGRVSVRTALASSLNVPAVWVATQISVEHFYDILQKAGFNSLEPSPEFYGYSLALGSADVDLLSLTNAYRMLANSGNYSGYRLVKNADVPFKKYRVFSEETAFIVSDILSDRYARLSTFGRDSALDTAIWTAVKTGTSRDMRDNWCIGYSRKYTVGVWVGNFSGAPMHDVSGVSGAAPIWHGMMSYLADRHSEELKKPPTPSSTLVRQKVHFIPNFEPDRWEWFLEGTAQSNFEVHGFPITSSLSHQTILYPVNGTIIAFDPDISLSRQRVLFSAKPSASAAGYTWRLNGVLLEVVKAHKGWIPIPGYYRLELLDHDQRRVDQVFFEVRDGGVRFVSEDPFSS